jgi:hypothetical protein
MLRVATSCSGQVQQPERPLPTDIAFTVSVKTFSDRAATSYGSEGWGSSPSERATVSAAHGHVPTVRLGRCCCRALLRPRPSEPCVRVAAHTAQASLAGGAG